MPLEGWAFDVTDNSNEDPDSLIGTNRYQVEIYNDEGHLVDWWDNHSLYEMTKIFAQGFQPMIESCEGVFDIQDHTDLAAILYSLKDYGLTFFGDWDTEQSIQERSYPYRETWMRVFNEGISIEGLDVGPDPLRASRLSMYENNQDSWQRFPHQPVNNRLYNGALQFTHPLDNWNLHITRDREGPGIIVTLVKPFETNIRMNHKSARYGYLSLFESLVRENVFNDEQMTRYYAPGVIKVDALNLFKAINAFRAYGVVGVCAFGPIPGFSSDRSFFSDSDLIIPVHDANHPFWTGRPMFQH